MTPRRAASDGRVVGVVLVGGRSRRMGRDKATIEVGGRSLVTTAVDALRGSGAGRVLLIGADDHVVDRAGVVAVPDDHPGEGPLGGILTALGHPVVGAAEVVVVLACDVPGATSSAVTAVVEGLRARPGALAAAPLVDGRLEPLHAAWRPAALEPVRERFVAGERSPQRLLALLGAVAVVGVDRDALTGVNTPAELDAAVRRLHPVPSGHTGGMPENLPLPEISVAELAERRPDTVVIDVRQPDEYEEGHVPGAVLIPLGQLNERHTEVPADADVYVICRSGGRSAAAVEALNNAGHRTVNVAGGTLAWIEAGHPVVTGSEPS